MNTIKFIVVVSIALLSTDLIYHQVVNGQYNETAKSMVDKLIQNTTRDKAIDQAFRTELIKRMQNTTCLTEAFKIMKGYLLFNTDYFTTQELVDILKQCVIEGKLK
jgi:flagellar biosynthesis protein FliP